jgi:hypothetical protein
MGLIMDTKTDSDFSAPVRFACGYFSMALAMPATLQITADGRLRLTLQSGKVMMDVPAALADCSDSGPLMMFYQWIRIRVGSRSYRLLMHNWDELGSRTGAAARNQIQDYMARIRQAAAIPADLSKPVIAAQLTPPMRHGVMMSYIMPVLTLGILPICVGGFALVGLLPEASRSDFVTALGMFGLPVAYLVALSMFLTHSNDRDLRRQAAADNSTQPGDILDTSALSH